MKRDGECIAKRPSHKAFQLGHLLAKCRSTEKRHRLGSGHRLTKFGRYLGQDTIGDNLAVYNHSIEVEDD